MHEQVHVNEWHTLDILLGEFSTIFYWFNPGVWLMKKAIRENIEFITDRKILRNGINTKQYQYSLVNVSFAAEPYGIVNYFNISTIKKRIIMMNAQRSSKFKLTRYACLVPAVIALLLVFSISKAAYTKKNNIKSHHLATANKPVVHIKPVKNVIINNAVAVVNEEIINKPAADTNHQIIPATVYMVDTNKNKSHVVSWTTDENQPAVFKIDGKIANYNDIKKIDPADIRSIACTKSSTGTSYVNVWTKNSPVPLVTSVRINGRTFNPLQGSKIGVSTDTFDTIKFDTVKYGVIKRIADTIRVMPLKNTVVTGNGLVTVYQHGKNTPGLSASVTQFPGSNRFDLHNSVGVVKYNSPFDNSVSLNHLSDKLIIINGKIASEKDLKKLPAFDIDKMVLKSDEETKELYGDKAKNGVLFIVTRKQK